MAYAPNSPMAAEAGYYGGLRRVVMEEVRCMSIWGQNEGVVVRVVVEDMNSLRDQNGGLKKVM